MSMTAGAQYALRLSVPPVHVELPVVRIDVGVESALAPVLPKYAWRCVARDRPGNTIGSSKLMCEKRQLVRKAPMPSLRRGGLSSGPMRGDGLVLCRAVAASIRRPRCRRGHLRSARSSWWSVPGWSSGQASSWSARRWSSDLRRRSSWWARAWAAADGDRPRPEVSGARTRRGGEGQWLRQRWPRTHAGGQGVVV